MGKKSLRSEIRNPEGYTYREWVIKVNEVLFMGWNLTLSGINIDDPKKLWIKGVTPKNAVNMCMGLEDVPGEELPDIDSYFYDDYTEEADVPHYLKPRG